MLLKNLSLALIGIVVGLLIIECGLRIYYPSEGVFFIREPNRNWTLHPSENVFPGAFGEKRYGVNEFGIRGDSPVSAEYRILAVGGSTTECLYLDQSEMWTQLLQEKLNFGRDTVWVGNAGKSANALGENELQVRYAIPKMPTIDLFLVMAGANDMLFYLKQYRRDPWLIAFDIVVDRHREGPWFKKSLIWQTLRNIKYRLYPHFVKIEAEDRSGETYELRRQLRRNSRETDVLPDSLDHYLEEYRQRLNAVANAIRTQNGRVVFLTQPAMWDTISNPGLERFLWFDYTSRDVYNNPVHYSSRALRSVLDRYNATMMDFCEKESYPCLDLATLLPRDTTVFYDDMHFNVSGSKQVAELLYAFLTKDWHESDAESRRRNAK